MISHTPHCATLETTLTLAGTPPLLPPPGMAAQGGEEGYGGERDPTGGSLTLSITVAATEHAEPAGGISCRRLLPLVDRLAGTDPDRPVRFGPGLIKTGG